MPTYDRPTISKRNHEVKSLKSEPIPWIWDGVIVSDRFTRRRRTPTRSGAP